MPGTVLSGIGTIPICQNGRRFNKPSEKKLHGSYLKAEITQAQDLAKGPREKVLSRSFWSSVAFIKQTSSSQDDLAFSDNSCESDKLNTCSRKPCRNPCKTAKDHSLRAQVRFSGAGNATSLFYRKTAPSAIAPAGEFPYLPLATSASALAGEGTCSESYSCRTGV